MEFADYLMQHASSRRPPRAQPATVVVRPDLAHRLLILLGLVLLLALPAQPARAGLAALELDGREQAVDLHSHVSLLRDPTGSLRLEQLPARAADFIPVRQRSDLNLGYTGEVIWLRLDLQSRAAEPSEWRIEFSRPSLDRVELFSVGHGDLQQQLGGDSVPAAQRSFDHRAPLFAVQLAPGEQRSLYFRANSSGNLALDARLWNARAFEQYAHSASLLLALYFGLLLGLASYNLLLFVALREPSLLFYVLFVASFAAGMLGFSGLGAQYLWPQGGAWGSRALPFSLALANAAAVLLARSFLDSAANAPLWHRWLRVDLGVQLAIAVGTLLLPLPLILQALVPTSIGNILLLLAYGIRCMRRGVPAASVFVGAKLLLMGGAVLLALRNFGLLPSNTISVNAMQIGSALEMLLLSFGLASRLNALRQQKVTTQASTLAAQQHSLQALQEQERVLEQRVAERTEALAAANERLRELALKDPLTGLANRVALRQHMEQVWQRARRRNEMLALIMLDLDGFKPVNDHYGHEAGDLLLIQVARRLQASARTIDLVARLGGDEFVLVCESIGSPEQAEVLAGRILESLGRPFRLLGLDVCIGASIGISFGLPPGGDCDALLREADQAMYEAKAAGRNCIRLGQPLSAEPPLGESVQRDES